MKILRAVPSLVQADPHLLAGLEHRDDLLGHGNGFTRARVASGARVALLDREGAEAAQFDAVTPRQRVRDGVEDGVDDVLDVALIEMRIALRDLLDELGFDHGKIPPSPCRCSYFSRAGCQRARSPSSETAWAATAPCRSRRAMSRHP